jgi:hypothetical protein
MVHTMTDSFLIIPIYEDGDVIVAAGDILRKEVVIMDNEFYTIIYQLIVWCIEYIIIPIGVAITARIIAEKLLQPQPARQKKKRL